MTMTIATMAIMIVNQLIVPGPSPYTPNHLMAAPSAATTATNIQIFLLFFNLLIFSMLFIVDVRNGWVNWRSVKPCYVYLIVLTSISITAAGRKLIDTKLVIMVKLKIFC